MVYQVAPPGHATPYHLHHVEDEAFYVLNGGFTFICDGAKTAVGPGGYMFLPRNTSQQFCSSDRADFGDAWERVRGDDGGNGTART